MASAKRPRRALHPVAALVALAFIGTGVSLISSSSHDRPVTVSAQVSARPDVPYTHQDLVDVHFADGSEDTVSANDSQALFDAVDRFGPGAARVTRQGSSIHAVEFRGKTYDISSVALDRAGGITALVLGVLILAGVIVSFAIPPTADASPAKESA